MTIQTILAVLSLVAPNSLVFAKHTSIWNEGVIPQYNRHWDASIIQQFNDPAENEVSNYNVCDTKECKQIAREFLRSMNKSVNPCENFYEFTCGAWSANNSIPPTEASWDRFKIFQNTIYRRLKGILEEKSERSDIRPVKQAKKWYRSCMNSKKLKRTGMKKIASILRQVGGWPITMDENEWNGEEHSWQEVQLHYGRLTGAHSLYTMKVLPPYNDGFLTILSPDIPLTNLLQEYRNYSGDYFNMYARLIERTANLFVRKGSKLFNDRSSLKERISREAREIVEFEKNIYEFKGNYTHSDSLAKIDECMRKLDINSTELKVDSKSKINWKSIIHTFINILSPKTVPINSIWIDDCEYFRRLGALLKRTPARTIVNYVHWNFVAKMLPYTTEWARNELFKIVHKEHGVKERRPRWSECVIDMKMSHAAAWAFINKYFSKSAESSIQQMIKYTRNAFSDQIEKSNFLDADSREWAKIKVRNMKLDIGFPDWYRNSTQLERYYKGSTVSADYFDNTLNYMRFDSKKLLQTFVMEENLDLWDIINPITVDSGFDEFYNKLAIGIANLQSPLFASEFPNNVNYGIAGFVIAHEMSHGFDNDGIRFLNGPNGTALPINVLRKYAQGERCFSEQYVKYFGENERETSVISGIRGENIADSTGVQSIFGAYKKMRKASSSVEMRLPGLEEFTDDQLFFLSFASMRCAVERSEYGSKKILSESRKQNRDKDIHSPPKFRVIAAISNSEDFATVFNCPKGSPMNPVTKCNIWQQSESTKSLF